LPLKISAKVRFFGLYSKFIIRISEYDPENNVFRCRDAIHRVSTAAVAVVCASVASLWGQKRRRRRAIRENLRKKNAKKKWQAGNFEFRQEKAAFFPPQRALFAQSLNLPSTVRPKYFTSFFTIKKRYFTSKIRSKITNLISKNQIKFVFV
jgi:hypothetical protein